MYTKLIHVLEYIRKCLQEGQISVLNGIMCFTKCNVGVDSGVNFGVTVYYGVLWILLHINSLSFGQYVFILFHMR
jgi:hypothetical protein